VTKLAQDILLTWSKNLPTPEGKREKTTRKRREKERFTSGKEGKRS